MTSGAGGAVGARITVEDGQWKRPDSVPGLPRLAQRLRP